MRTPILRFVSIVNLHDGYSIAFLGYLNEVCVACSTHRDNVYDTIVSLGKSLHLPFYLEGEICVGDLHDSAHSVVKAVFDIPDSGDSGIERAAEEMLEAVSNLDSKVCFEIVDKSRDHGWTKVYLDGTQITLLSKFAIEHHDVFDDNECALIEAEGHFIRSLAVAWPVLLISRKLLLSGFQNHSLNFDLVLDHIKTVLGGDGKSFAEAVVTSAIFALEQDLEKSDGPLNSCLEPYDDTFTAFLNSQLSD